MVIFGGGAHGSAYKDAFGLTLPDDEPDAAWHTLSPTHRPDRPRPGDRRARRRPADGLRRVRLRHLPRHHRRRYPLGRHVAAPARPPGRLAAGHADRRDTGADRPGGHGVRPGRDRAHRLLLFGGLTGDTTLADVWAVDLRRPGRPALATAVLADVVRDRSFTPLGRHAVYDPVAERFVVFGGLTENGTTANDVWALDLSGTPTWHELTPDGPRPPARWSAAYGFDPVRQRFVVFGGQTGPDATGVGAAGHVGAVARRRAALDRAGHRPARCPTRGAARRPPFGSPTRARSSSSPPDCPVRRASTTTTCGHWISATTRPGGSSSPPTGRASACPPTLGQRRPRPGGRSPDRRVRPRRPALLRRDVGLRLRRPDLAPAADLMDQPSRRTT